MEKSNRVLTIDIMRGLTLLLMLFVNDLFVPGVPKWMVHTETNFDGMGLADWVFPGFLFMVGMAIPFAFHNRIRNGDSILKLTVHIFIRTASLIIIGVLMLNFSRLNPELTGIRKNLWAILVLVSIFLTWNQYRILNKYAGYFLKGLGIAGLIILSAIFKSGSPEHVTWLRTGWWGIPGLIGWGYLVAALVYLVARENLLVTGLFVLIFFILNVAGELKLMQFLDPLKPVFGVIISGSTPLLVLFGLLFSLIVRKLSSADLQKFLIIGLVFGCLAIISGFVLRNWFIISKNLGTPSWVMICTGINIIVFIVLFLIIDVWHIKRWTVIFKPAGQNSLTTYLAPDILYYLIWMFSIPVFFYKQSDSQILAVAGSAVWAFSMVGFTALLDKSGIRLRL